MRGCRLSAAAPDFDIYNRIKAVRSYAPYADIFLFGFPVVLVLLLILLILTLFVLLILLILLILILLILILLILILLVLVLVMIFHYSSPCRTSAEYFVRINIFYRKQSIP